MQFLAHILTIVPGYDDDNNDDMSEEDVPSKGTQCGRLSLRFPPKDQLTNVY